MSTNINSVVVYLEKITGTVETANNAKKTKWLKDGRAYLTVKGKQESVRVNWMGADEELMNKGVTVFMDIETSEYNGKTFTNLNIRKATGAFSSENMAMITGKVTGVKEFQKMMSVDVLVSSLDYKTQKVITATQKVSILDKNSAVAANVKANLNNEMLFIGQLTANNGFSDYVISSASTTGGGAPSTASPASTEVAPEDDVF